jgi:hypothetical protein
LRQLPGIKEADFCSEVLCFACNILVTPIFSQAADTQVISDYVRYFLHQHT